MTSRINPAPDITISLTQMLGTSAMVLRVRSAAVCQFAAGAAQTLGGHPDKDGTLATGFDTPSDNASIREGQAMRAEGCRCAGL
jgi:hypothetical protein